MVDANALGWRCKTIRRVGYRFTTGGASPNAPKPFARIGRIGRLSEQMRRTRRRSLLPFFSDVEANRPDRTVTCKK
ncbi:hypothetical protein WQQ_38230 [Hydrocarboniphaga effusa AP103]|uniref:Uncharacterized protein n=1 Tax=Hydrocarboniphaga effusa AP103 TaxID=1172194 RepID=I8T4I1_9GAMM|nr:hypothetical protein WQQ_38230 [Hydrocarboniphaga effusa AP103]